MECVHCILYMDKVLFNNTKSRYHCEILTFIFAPDFDNTRLHVAARKHWNCT